MPAEGDLQPQTHTKRVQDLQGQDVRDQVESTGGFHSQLPVLEEKLTLGLHRTDADTALKFAGFQEKIRPCRTDSFLALVYTWKFGSISAVVFLCYEPSTFPLCTWAEVKVLSIFRTFVKNWAKAALLVLLFSYPYSDRFGTVPQTWSSLAESQRGSLGSAASCQRIFHAAGAGMGMQRLLLGH